MTPEIWEFVRKVVIVFLVLYGLGIVFIFWTQPRGAPWVPTPRAKIYKMLEMADVKRGDTVYDLGSGDGRVLFIAARSFNAHAVGIELDLLRYLWTRLWITVLKLRDRVSVIWGDFFVQDIGDADVIVLFLRQSTNELLMLKLLTELRPGSRVVSHLFTFPGWETGAQDEKDRLYLYHVGMKSD